MLVLERAMRPLSPSLATSGLLLERGTSARNELVPQHSNRHARWPRQCARTSRQRGGPKTLRDSRLCASSRRDRTAPCAVRRRARPVGGPRAGRERPRCRVACAAPGIARGGRSRPAVSMPMRRACSRPRPANSPEEPASFEHVSMSRPGFTQTAITSGSLRARRGVVQGSPLRSDRALCARLARVGVRPGGPSLAVSARP
jgi:hypothetical protein